jgi:prephenate dehydrogenase
MTKGTALIQGTGLIGASVGLALRATGWRVIGSDPDAAALAAAVAKGAIDGTAADPLREPADLVVLAGPPEATVATLRSMSTQALVTDVAGVKGPVVAAASHLPHFVGGHPMTGLAQSGAALASANLFRGAAWILTTDNATGDDLDRLRDIIGSLGAHPITMSAREHDRAVARISHLPHLLAASLVDLASGDATAMSLVAGSFRDLTRVASSEATWWTEVMTANAPEIDEAIAGLEERLGKWRRALQQHSSDDIRRSLRQAQETRQRFSLDVANVQVPLFDEPGELARVGRALGKSAADVRDIQLRHAEHGGGGVLTLAVNSRHAAALRQALADEEFSPE